MVIGLTTDLQIVGLRGSCHRQVCIQHNITRKVAVELTTQCAIRPWKLYVLFWQFNSEASCKEFSQHSCWSRCPTGDVGGSCGQSWTPWSAHHLLNTPIWKHTGGSHLRTISVNINHTTRQSFSHHRMPMIGYRVGSSRSQLRREGNELWLTYGRRWRPGPADWSDGMSASCTAPLWSSFTLARSCGHPITTNFIKI